MEVAAAHAPPLPVSLGAPATRDDGPTTSAGDFTFRSSGALPTSPFTFVSFPFFSPLIFGLFRLGLSYCVLPSLAFLFFFLFFFALFLSSLPPPPIA